MNYQNTLTYLYNSVPMFQHVGGAAYKEGLENTQVLDKHFGHPHRSFRTIHVAGTNGKGSCSHTLAAILQEAGYRVGLYTSPHLVDFRERIRINGQPIPEKYVVDFVEKERDFFEPLHPSFFELTTAMAFRYFADEKVDVAVIEVGLGGRLDCTNIIHPDLCIITNISFDHIQFLGDTLAKIAGEKAGIIKAGVPVIYDASQPGPASVIAAKAKEMGSPAWPMEPSFYEMKTQSREGITFTFAYPGGEKAELAIPYVAKYQMMNASLAFYTMHILQDVHDIPKNVLAEGLSKIKWPCRMEMAAPGVIIDGAHNEDGIAQFVSTAGYFAKENEITILFTAVADKHYHEMIGEICEGIHPSHVVATQIDGSRVVPAEVLAEDFRKAGCTDVCAEPEIGAAYEKALGKKGSGMLFCVGSLYLAGELKAYLAKRNG